MTDIKYFGGLDVGTTGCKIVVFDSNGKHFKTYYTEYDSTHSGGNHEIDFVTVKNGVMQVLKNAANDCTLESIGVSSFGETFAMLDDADNVLSASMLYTDPRGTEQCNMLCNAVGEKKLTHITGVKPDKMYSISKIMWHRDNNSNAFEKCTKILLGEDYIVYSLTGKRKIDYSLAARTAAFDIRNKCWCKEIFDAAGISVDLMSEAVETGSYAGKITDKVKTQLGIDYDIDVVCGCHDQVAAMIGAGVFEKGIAMDGTGTVECIPVVLDSVPDSDGLYDGGYSVVPFINGKYACYALSFTGGATLKWFRDNFAESEHAQCKANDKNVYAYLDSMAPKKPTDILVLPHFAGAATPYMDTDAKAAFIGVTLETTKIDLYRALMEGTSYEILLNFNKLKSFTGEVYELRATGGGASSDVWLQIKADILNTKICAMSQSETGAIGTAALAALHKKLYNDLKGAINSLSSVSKQFEPIKENTVFYKKQYNRYKNLYNAVKGLDKEDI